MSLKETVSAARAHALAWSRRSEILKGALVGLAAGALVLPFILFSSTPSQAPGIIATADAVSNGAFPADLGDAVASEDVRTVADWVATTRDAGNGPFVIVDKTYARLHVFDGAARHVASTPILLGGARGDHTVADIGSRAIEDILPEERTTPAGRFVAERGRNASLEDVVWVDYDSGVSIHRVRATDPRERRLERLATPTHEDNRISWGCLNVPVAFYESHVRPMFATQTAIVYILPEVRTLAEVFGLGTAKAKAHYPLAAAASAYDIRP